MVVVYHCKRQHRKSLQCPLQTQIPCQTPMLLRDSLGRSVRCHDVAAFHEGTKSLFQTRADSLDEALSPVGVQQPRPVSLTGRGVRRRRSGGVFALTGHGVGVRRVGLVCGCSNKQVQANVFCATCFGPLVSGACVCDPACVWLSASCCPRAKLSRVLCVVCAVVH